jgi:DNA invertase Pin-like site-specific DNA recombinase
MRSLSDPHQKDQLSHTKQLFRMKPKFATTYTCDEWPPKLPPPSTNFAGDPNSGCRWTMLTVLSELAEFEHALIRTRTGEGRARAKARGVKMGRPPKMTPHQIKEALERRLAGEPMRDIARSYNVSHSTISRLGA